jgi:hypothetical protein
MFSEITTRLLEGAAWQGLCAALALGAQHLVLYRWPLRLSRPTAFIVGLGTLLVFCTVWGIWARELTPAVDPLVAVLAFWIICGAGGVIVALAYWARKRFNLWEASVLAAGLAAAPGDQGHGAPHHRAGYRDGGGRD